MLGISFCAKIMRTRPHQQSFTILKVSDASMPQFRKRKVITHSLLIDFGLDLTWIADLVTADFWSEFAKASSSESSEMTKSASSAAFLFHDFWTSWKNNHFKTKFLMTRLNIRGVFKLPLFSMLTITYPILEPQLISPLRKAWHLNQRGKKEALHLQNLPKSSFLSLTFTPRLTTYLYSKFCTFFCSNYFRSSLSTQYSNLLCWHELFCHFYGYNSR